MGLHLMISLKPFDWRFGIVPNRRDGYRAVSVYFGPIWVSIGAHAHSHVEITDAK